MQVHCWRKVLWQAEPLRIAPGFVIATFAQLDPRLSIVGSCGTVAGPRASVTPAHGSPFMHKCPDVEAFLFVGLQFP